MSECMFFELFDVTFTDQLLWTVGAEQARSLKSMCPREENRKAKQIAQYHQAAFHLIPTCEPTHAGRRSGIWGGSEVCRFK